MRDPNFMRPTRSPARDMLSRLHAAHDPAREHADDLPEHDGCAVVVDPDLCPLIVARLRPVGRQETSGLVLDARSTRPETGVRLMCTSIGDRKIAICSHVAWAAPQVRRGTRNHDAAVGRRQTRRSDRLARCGRDRGRSTVKKPPSAANGAAQPGRLSATSTAAGASAPTMNGSPARSIFMVTEPAGARRGPGVSMRRARHARPPRARSGRR